MPALSVPNRILGLEPMTFSTEDIEGFNAFEKNGWERAADAYHDHWGALSAQSALPMLDLAGVRQGAHVLDVATGAGYVAAAAQGIGAIPIGLDFSGAQVALPSRNSMSGYVLRANAT